MSRRRSGTQAQCELDAPGELRPVRSLADGPGRVPGHGLASWGPDRRT